MGNRSTHDCHEHRDSSHLATKANAQAEAHREAALKARAVVQKRMQTQKLQHEKQMTNARKRQEQILRASQEREQAARLAHQKRMKELKNADQERKKQRMDLKSITLNNLANTYKNNSPILNKMQNQLMNAKSTRALQSNTLTMARESPQNLGSSPFETFEKMNSIYILMNNVIQVDGYKVGQKMIGNHENIECFDIKHDGDYNKYYSLFFNNDEKAADVAKYESEKKNDSVVDVDLSIPSPHNSDINFTESPSPLFPQIFNNNYDQSELSPPPWIIDSKNDNNISGIHNINDVDALKSIISELQMRLNDSEFVKKLLAFETKDDTLLKERGLTLAKSVEDCCLNLITNQAQIRQSIFLAQEILKYQPANMNDDKTAQIWEAVDVGINCILQSALRIAAVSVEYFGFFLRFQNSFKFFISSHCDENLSLSSEQLKKDVKLITLLMNMDNNAVLTRFSLLDGLQFETMLNDENNKLKVDSANYFEKLSEIQDIITATEWYKVPVFEKINVIKETTLSMSNMNFISNVSEFIKDKIHTNLIITSMETMLFIVRIFEGVDIGVLLKYNHPNNCDNGNNIQVTGIYLDKQRIYDEFNISCGECDCLDQFETDIDELIIHVNYGLNTNEYEPLQILSDYSDTDWETDNTESVYLQTDWDEWEQTDEELDEKMEDICLNNLFLRY